MTEKEYISGNLFPENWKKQDVTEKKGEKEGKRGEKKGKKSLFFGVWDLL